MLRRKEISEKKTCYKKLCDEKIGEEKTSDNKIVTEKMWQKTCDKNEFRMTKLWIKINVIEKIVIIFLRKSKMLTKNCEHCF